MTSNVGGGDIVTLFEVRNGAVLRVGFGYVECGCLCDFVLVLSGVSCLPQPHSVYLYNMNTETGFLFVF